jgi:hypothetical protein
LEDVAHGRTKAAEVKQGSGHQHPRELRERAVRMAEETFKETGERHGVVTSGASKRRIDHGQRCNASGWIQLSRVQPASGNPEENIRTN